MANANGSATVTGPRDVNAQFASEKLAQLATVNSRKAWLDAQVGEGNFILQGDRYIVINGWDRGESFSAKTTQPEHGLDLTENGDVALYLKDMPAWHSLGTVIKGGSSNAETVLKTGGMWWETLQTPTTFTIQMDNGQYVTQTVPNSFTNYRSDNFQPLGTVGKIYTPVHNATAFDFLDHLFGENLMIAESAGSFREGRRVFISAELPGELLIDPQGVADHVKMFVVLINSHDGSTPFMALVTPWRPVCKNTERLALKNAKYKWTVRHTKNAMGKIEEAKRTLGLATAYYDQFVEEETALLQVPFNGADVDALIADVWGELDKDAHKRTRTVHENRTDAVKALYGVESQRVGRNAYAAERAVTGYVDHFAELRPRGALKGNRLAAAGQAIMEETYDDVKSRTHKRLMTMTNR